MINKGKGNVLGVLPSHEVRRHGATFDREPDLVEDDVLDRALLDALLLGAHERRIQVRTDHSLRAGVLQRVALPAAPLRLEELLPRTRVPAVRGPTGAAAARD